ncbi:MAG: amidohydrolase family protein [Streptosporangiaceae bacterium]
MTQGPAGQVAIPGFADHHAHLLKEYGGVPFAWQGGTVREFHERVHRSGSTPMDVAEPACAEPLDQLAARLVHGLSRAAAAGLTEVTEMGMRQWWYLDALERAARSGRLPARVRIYLASGLAENTNAAELHYRRAACGDYLRLEGIKFYADGWLVPRTCAVCATFADEPSGGILFQDSGTLARRIEPFAAAGWRIATHAIGDRAVEAVLDAYEKAWGGDRAAIAAAGPRIEHGSVIPGSLADRIADLGVTVCIQPSFPVTDALEVPAALGRDRAALAYPYAALAARGVVLLSGTDYPIEVLEPLAGLARLVNGRSRRPGFDTGRTAPAHSRLSLDLALRISTDPGSGRTVLSADPLAAGPGGLDAIEVLGTDPAPFPPASPAG